MVWWCGAVGEQVETDDNGDASIEFEETKGQGGFGYASEAAGCLHRLGQLGELST